MFVLIFKILPVGLVLLADGKQLTPVGSDLSFSLLEIFQSIVVFLVDLPAYFEIRPFGHLLPLEARLDGQQLPLLVVLYLFALGLQSPIEGVLDVEAFPLVLSPFGWTVLSSLLGSD